MCERCESVDNTPTPARLLTKYDLATWAIGTAYNLLATLTNSVYAAMKMVTYQQAVRESHRTQLEAFTKELEMLEADNG